MLERIGLTRLGIAVAVLYWPLEALLHEFVFSEGKFIDKLFSNDPHELWMRSIISAMFIAFGWVGQRMLDRQHILQREFQRQKNRLQKIIDSAYDAYVAMDSSGRIIGWNRSAESLFGWPLRDAMGRQLGETIMPEEVRTTFERGLDKYLETGVGSWLYKPMRTQGIRRDGGRIEIEMVVVPLQSNGQQEFFAFIRPQKAAVSMELHANGNG